MGYPARFCAYDFAAVQSFQAVYTMKQKRRGTICMFKFNKHIRSGVDKELFRFFAVNTYDEVCVVNRTEGKVRECTFARMVVSNQTASGMT